jgi:hypothetical protein
MTNSITAQETVVPILDFKVGGLIGGVLNGKYIDAKQTAEKINDKTGYMVYDFSGIKPNSRIFPLTKSKEEDICPDFIGVRSQDEKPFNLAVGAKARWKVMPRIPQNLNKTGAVYKKVVADFLKTKGFAKPLIKIEQAFRIDLEGDGQDEVILTATRALPYNSKKEGAIYDEYSFILLRKTVGGKVKNILLAGEFYPKNEFEYDGNTFEISSLADLNGDGKLEIVVYSRYYEGHALNVFEMKAGSPSVIETLGAGCGI